MCHFAAAHDIVDGVITGDNAVVELHCPREVGATDPMHPFQFPCFPNPDRGTKLSHAGIFEPWNIGYEELGKLVAPPPTLLCRFRDIHWISAIDASNYH